MVAWQNGWWCSKWDKLPIPDKTAIPSPHKNTRQKAGANNIKTEEIIPEGLLHRLLFL
jgi:hypothetical protein